jgi:hypothetical protein
MTLADSERLELDAQATARTVRADLARRARLILLLAFADLISTFYTIINSINTLLKLNSVPDAYCSSHLRPAAE